MNATYQVESKDSYSPWKSVKVFDQYKPALEFKKLNCTDSKLEYRIVKCETVTITTNLKKLICEKS
jgi:hypothetical protein